MISILGLLVGCTTKGGQEPDAGPGDVESCTRQIAADVPEEDWTAEQAAEWQKWVAWAGTWEITFGSGSGTGLVRVEVPPPELQTTELIAGSRGECKAPLREQTSSLVEGVEAAPVVTTAVRAYDGEPLFEPIAASGDWWFFLHFEPVAEARLDTPDEGCIVLADGTEVCPGVRFPMTLL